MTPLTFVQALALGCFAQGYSKSVSDVAVDLCVSDGSARSTLNALERRGLVARTYTGGTRHKFLYALTVKGKEVLDAHFAE